MDDVEKLLKSTVAELDKLLDARQVMGETIEREGAAVIPIVSYGFGFGAGGAAGQKGNSGGTGAGGGIKPVGAIIFDQSGARVEAVKGTASAIAKIIGETAAHAMDKSKTGDNEA
jgi:uncharacterized spore protein YtfJ